MCLRDDTRQGIIVGNRKKGVTKEGRKNQQLLYKGDKHLGQKRFRKGDGGLGKARRVCGNKKAKLNKEK